MEPAVFRIMISQNLNRGVRWARSYVEALGRRCFYVLSAQQPASFLETTGVKSRSVLSACGYSQPLPAMPVLSTMTRGAVYRIHIQELCSELKQKTKNTKI